jgi:hypothetical protein
MQNLIERLVSGYLKNILENRNVSRHNGLAEGTVPVPPPLF